MKQLFALAALLFLTAGAAQANSVLNSLEANKDGFIKQYNLDTFEIAPESLALRGISPTNGAVYLDRDNRTLRIQLSRETGGVQPAARNRLAWVPAPLILDLPVTYIGSPFCGGRVITAEEDNRRADGALIRVQVVDDNGNRCDGTVDDGTFVKRVSVTVEEQAARSNETVVSTLTGFPVQKLSLDISIRR